MCGLLTLTSSEDELFLTKVNFSNKAVLNSSPLLPYIFLFLQMLIAVILLHLFSLFSPRIILPTYKELTLSNAKTLTPVVVCRPSMITGNPNYYHLPAG